MTEGAAPADGASQSRFSTYWRIALLLGYVGCILYFGTSRNSVIPPIGLLSSDKVLHALVFGGLAALTYRVASQFWLNKSRWFCAGVGVAFAGVIGGLLELAQSQLAYRSAEWLDFVADLFGALVIVTIAAKLRLERPLRQILVQRTE